MELPYASPLHRLVLWLHLVSELDPAVQRRGCKAGKSGLVPLWTGKS